MNKIVKIADLEAQIARIQAIMDARNERMAKGETDEDDCFISIKVNSDAIKEANMQIDIIKQGGTAWFDWYMDMDGNPCTDARWVETKYGLSLVVNCADGRTVWTTAQTAKGLAKKGLKKVEARFPVWTKSYSNGSGMYGVFSSWIGTYRAELNRATGEYHPTPYEIREIEVA